MGDMPQLAEPEVLVKSWTDEAELKMAGADENELVGVAAGIGNIDRAGDVFLPGAFLDAIPAMVKDGGVLPGHQWGAFPVAMFTGAEETPKGLTMTAKFHSDAEAQRARTIVMERMAEGKSVGLSVGVRPDYKTVVYFENGKALVKWADDSGVKLRERANIAKWESYCRVIPKVLAVWEVSLVNIPCNPQAGVTMAKNLAPESTKDCMAGIRAMVQTLKDGRDLNDFAKDLADMTAEMVALNKANPLPAERARAQKVRYQFVRGCIAGNQ